MALATMAPAASTNSRTEFFNDTVSSSASTFRIATEKQLLTEHRSLRNQGAHLAQVNSSSPSVLNRPDPTLEALADAIQTIFAFSVLEEDWDSYGGIPPSDDARICATRFVLEIAESLPAALSHHHDITPVPDGGIQIEWTTEVGHIEFEFEESGSVFILSAPKNADITTLSYDPTSSISDSVAELEELWERLNSV